MGSDQSKMDNQRENCLTSILEDLNDNIKSIIEKTDSLSKNKEVVKLLTSFLMSDDFIPFYFLTNGNFIFCFYYLFRIQDKFLFPKILFPLLEELKKQKFENKLWEAENSESEKDNILLSYYKKKETSANKENKSIKIGKKEKNALQQYAQSFKDIINFIFKKQKNKNNKDFFASIALYVVVVQLDLKEEKFQELLVYLEQLEESLNYTKELFYLIIFSMNILINMDKIEELDKNREDKSKNFDKLLNTVDLNKNFIWVFYEQTYKNKNNKKYIEYAYVGTKLYKSETFQINAFKTINKKDIIKPIDAYIASCLFSNFEVIMIKLDMEYFKKYKTNIEELKKDINAEIEAMNKSNNLPTYIIIEKKLIRYPQSYDLFLQELLENKIYKEEEIAEEKKKIEKEEVTIKQNNKKDKCIANDLKEKHFDKVEDIKMKNDKTQIENIEINELKTQLNNEKSKNKDLEEKIAILENKLKEEKSKYDKEKSEISKLKSELNNEIEKYKNLNEKIKFKEVYKNDSSTESKDILLEKLFESEKEVKEIKLKLSRFPFELNEGEKLLCIIFTSCDQNINCPIICKNTEKFNVVENRLYEKFPEYKESENYFTFEGTKINKYVTLDENKIKDGDNILLNVIE